MDENIPVIFLTAKSLKEDRIEGFKLGCDDYITKPFSMEELLLRINAVLRRSSGPADNCCQMSKFAFNNYLFDYEKQQLICGGNMFELTTKEAELFKLLCIHMNKTRGEGSCIKNSLGGATIISTRAAWMYLFPKSGNTLKDDPSVNIINVHGKGYKFSVEKVE